LDSPGTSGHVPQGAPEVPRNLRVIVRGLTPSRVAAGNSESSESDIIHDHVRPSQNQIAAIARFVVGIDARYVVHARTTEPGETMCSSSRGRELSSGRESTKMITGGCSYANGKVFVEGVGEHLVPTAQAWGLWRPAFQVAARFA
jgi:hypothetical protein